MSNENTQAAIEKKASGQVLSAQENQLYEPFDTARSAFIAARKYYFHLRQIMPVEYDHSNFYQGMPDLSDQALADNFHGTREAIQAKIIQRQLSQVLGQALEAKSKLDDLLKNPAVAAAVKKESITKDLSLEETSLVSQFADRFFRYRTLAGGYKAEARSLPADIAAKLPSAEDYLNNIYKGNANPAEGGGSTPAAMVAARSGRAANTAVGTGDHHRKVAIPLRLHGIAALVARVA